MISEPQDILLDGMNNRKSDLESSIKQNQQQIDDNNIRITDLKAEIAEYEADVAELNSITKGLKSECDLFKPILDTFSKNAINDGELLAGPKVDKVEQNKQLALGEFGHFLDMPDKQWIETIESTIKIIQEKIETNNTVISSLVNANTMAESQISSSNRQVASLDTQINSLNN